MHCNSEIHDEFINMREPTCPFCDKILLEIKKVVDVCCTNQEMKDVNGINICVNCGSVAGYNYVAEYFNFYDKLHLIRGTSRYHRKYHIDNVINSISFENDIQLSHYQRDKIHKVFTAIDNIFHDVDHNRKRIISIKYILQQLFKMLGLPYNCISVTKSKKTLKYYEQHWNSIMILIGNDIYSILGMENELS